jgi:hypothetical protein
MVRPEALADSAATLAYPGLCRKGVTLADSRAELRLARIGDLSEGHRSQKGMLDSWLFRGQGGQKGMLDARLLLCCHRS